MSWWLIWALLSVGAMVGMLVTALCVAAGEQDEAAEEEARRAHIR